MKKECLVFILIIFGFISFASASVNTANLYYTPSCALVQDSTTCSQYYTSTYSGKSYKSFLCKWESSGNEELCNRIFPSSSFSVFAECRDLNNLPKEIMNSVCSKTAYYDSREGKNYNCYINSSNNRCEKKLNACKTRCVTSLSREFKTPAEKKYPTKAIDNQNVKEKCTLNDCFGFYVNSNPEILKTECIPSIWTYEKSCARAGGGDACTDGFSGESYNFRDFEASGNIAGYSLSCNPWGLTYKQTGITTETECSDGIDNDYDGKIDCEDSDCENKECTIAGFSSARCYSGYCAVLNSADVSLGVGEEYLNKMKFNKEYYLQKTKIPRNIETSDDVLVISPYDELTCSANIALVVKRNGKPDFSKEVIRKMPSLNLGIDFAGKTNNVNCKLSSYGNEQDNSNYKTFYYSCNEKFDGTWKRGSRMKCSVKSGSYVVAESPEVVVAKYLFYFMSVNEGYSSPWSNLEKQVENIISLSSLNKDDSLAVKPVYLDIKPIIDKRKFLDYHQISNPNGYDELCNLKAFFVEDTFNREYFNKYPESKNLLKVMDDEEMFYVVSNDILAKYSACKEGAFTYLEKSLEDTGRNIVSVPAAIIFAVARSGGKVGFGKDINLMVQAGGRIIGAPAIGLNRFFFALRENNVVEGFVNYAIEKPFQFSSELKSVLISSDEKYFSIREKSSGIINPDADYAVGNVFLRAKEGFCDESNAQIWHIENYQKECPNKFPECCGTNFGLRGIKTLVDGAISAFTFKDPLGIVKEVGGIAGSALSSLPAKIADIMNKNGPDIGYPDLKEKIIGFYGSCGDDLSCCGMPKDYIPNSLPLNIVPPKSIAGLDSGCGERFISSCNSPFSSGCST